MKVAERIFIIVVMIFSFAVIREGVKIPIMSEYAIGPGFLPLVIGIGMAIVSFVMLIKNIIKHKGEREEQAFIKKEGAIRLGFFVAVLLVSLMLNKILGLVIPLIIFMTIIYRYIEKYSWWTSIRVSVICNIIFYVLFQMWLGVPLPGINL